MLNTALISNDGPLGDIWLAANYDKKLTKHQLLNTNIVESAKYITNRTHHIGNQTEDSNISTDMDAITLRLSGQLLLGVTKIYSRKTKYLLDDINDVLYKLRAVFRMSSGVQLGPDGGVSTKVNLPPQQTTIADLNTITLKDQVTGFDLLWQENLQLEEEPINPMDTVFNNDNDSLRLDTSVGSIEYGRLEDRHGGDDIADDEDINLDFDLNLDDDGQSFAGSIELGRNASNAGDEIHNSVLEGHHHKSNNIFELDLGQPLQNIDDFDIDFDDGYMSSSSIAHNEQPPVENQSEATQSRARQRQRQRRTRITDDGQMVVVNKKLVVDSSDHLQLSLDTLRENQHNALTHTVQPNSTKMSNNDKLLLIQQMSLPAASKKRKLWDFSTDFHFRIPLAKDDSDDEGEHENSTDDSDDSIDNSLDDISMSDNESEKGKTTKSRKVDDDDKEEEEDDDDEEEESVDESFCSDGVENVAKSTKQAADELQDLFRLDATVTFEDFVKSDTTAVRPLGLKNKEYVNHKREASRCFFELLVLATNDCINLHQESSNLNIQRDLHITSRDSLFSFV